MNDSDNPFDLASPVLAWSPAAGDCMTIADAMEGIASFGQTGGGKTSGSGRAIAQALLTHPSRPGFLVLCAKPDERATWERYAAACGRSNDLMVFSPASPYRIDFLDHLVQSDPEGGGLTPNITAILLELVDAGSGQRSTSSDSFWRREEHKALSNAIDLLRLAGQRVSLPNIQRVVMNAPTSATDIQNATFCQHSYCMMLLNLARDRTLTQAERSDLLQVLDYYTFDYATLDERPQSIVRASITGMCAPLLRSQIREMICHEGDISAEQYISPEDTHHGRILVIDFPILRYHEVGRLIAVIWKRLWQLAAQNRDVRENPRPIVFWADEGHLFVSPQDTLFQSTARAFRCITVLLTQNLSTLVAGLGGGDRGRAEAMGLLGNLSTKIWHANGDPEVNQWAADSIGRDRVIHSGFSVQTSGVGGSVSGSETFEYQVPPVRFTTLRKGGPTADFSVDGYVFQPGRTWAGNDGRNHLLVRFQQQPREADGKDSR